MTTPLLHASVLAGFFFNALLFFFFFVPVLFLVEKQASLMWSLSLSLNDFVMLFSQEFLF